MHTNTTKMRIDKRTHNHAQKWTNRTLISHKQTSFHFLVLTAGVRLHAGHERHVVTEIRLVTLDCSHVFCSAGTCAARVAPLENSWPQAGLS